MEVFELNDTIEKNSEVELLLNDKIKTNDDTNISLDKELEELNNINIEKTDEPTIGKSTVEYNEPVHIDFKKIDDINIENENIKAEENIKEDLLNEKFELLRKLDYLESKGANISKKYSMDSSLDEMRGEYESLIKERETKNSINFQGKVLTTFITGLEFLNNKLDPFDIKLDGWSEQINENINDYDEIFEELHKKYKSKAKMAPEVKLVFQLASSAMMIHMTNTMFKSAIPGMDDIMRQNPDLMNNFTKAAVNSMSKNSPGLSNFMNDFGMSHSPDPPQSGPADVREEMKGPENINDILNNINKNININNESTISVEDVDNISLTSNPSISKKKKKNDKNTISLAV
jgi:hypothetical protein